MKKFKLQIQKYVLFGFNIDKVQGGINDILFQSDSLKEIFSFMDNIHRDTFQILDIESNTISVIENEQKHNIVNYNPNHLKIGDSVWCVSGGLPSGTVINIGDEITIQTDNGIFKEKSEKFFKNI